MNTQTFVAPSPTSASSDSSDLNSARLISRKEVVQSTKAESKRSPNSLVTKTPSRRNVVDGSKQAISINIPNKDNKKRKIDAVESVIHSIQRKKTVAQLAIEKHNSDMLYHWKNSKLRDLKCNKGMPDIDPKCKYKLIGNPIGEFVTWMIDAPSGKCPQCGYEWPTNYIFAGFYAGCILCFHSRYNKYDEYKEYKKNFKIMQSTTNDLCEEEILRRLPTQIDSADSLMIFRDYYLEIFGENGCDMVFRKNRGHAKRIRDLNNRITDKKMQITQEKMSKMYVPYYWPLWRPRRRV
jgi:hypothetical protein